MAGPSDLTVLLMSRHAEDFPQSIVRVAPTARVCTRRDLDADQSLIERVDIVYGRLRAELFARARRLKWIHTTAAGADWSQRPEVVAYPCLVTNSRIHAVQISEHLFGMLLMLTHRLGWAYARQLEHVWDSPGLKDVRTLPGRTLCILGLGTIGRRCAELGAAHEMRVIGVKRHPEPVPHVQRVLGPDRLNEALGQAEVVMNLLPGTRQTEKLIGPQQFQAMADGALFLNAGRGKTVDTDAMIEALRSGRLAGAGLDVVDPEPLPPQHPLWDMPNVIITAHYSGLVDDYFEQTEALFLDNLRRFLAGEPLVGLVDKQAGY